MKIGANGLAIVKAFEGCHRAVKGRPGYFKAYLDPVNVLTIGYGHTNHHEPQFDADAVWSQAKCDAVLADDMATFERHVSRQAKVPLKQHEFDALVSWAFNTGGPASAGLWKSLNSGNKGDVPSRLLMWDKAGGKTLAGLTRRRQSEAALFEGDIDIALRIAGVKGKPKPKPAEDKPIPTPPPPDIEPTPKPEKKSRLRTFWEWTGLGAVLGTLSFGGAKFEVDHLFILALCLLVLVGGAVYWFLTRRKR
jgi:lysozyme